MSLDPARMLRNAMRRPFADHVGVPSYDRFRVRSTCLEPSARIKKMSKFPVRWLSKTILRPFGDHSGQQSSAAANVRRRTCEPSTRIRKMSGLPAREDMNARWRPPGAHVGKRFPAVVLVILLRFEPSPFISHNSTPPALLLESDADRVSPHRGDRRPDCGEDDDERNNDTSTDCDGYSSYPPAAFRKRTILIRG
jgi:hypothetical protein